MKKSKMYHYDSANISESYSGIVLPLTQTFAKMVYSQVYQDLLRMSGVSAKKISQHIEIFDNLLAFFYGRMYYNMNNWYLMAAFFPGYKQNKQNFEAMITSNIKEEIDTSIKPSFIFKIFYPTIVLSKTFIYDITAKRFKHNVSKELQILRSQNLDQLDYINCIEKFSNINIKLLRNWYIAIENDFFVMTYLGILKKIVSEQELQNLIRFESKSTEQIESLSKLSKKMSLNKELWKYIQIGNTKQFASDLNNYPALKKALNEYLSDFGGRFANELKLESKGIDEDYSKLFEVLKVYKDFHYNKPVTINRPINLPRTKKSLLNFILNRFKYHASLREEFRLLRSNTFAASRHLFRRMGKILVKQNKLNQVDDVFYLELSELLDKKSLSNKNLKNIVRERKKLFTSYQQVTLPSHFSSSNNQIPIVVNKSISQEKYIKANPASPGKIKGKVRIFKEYSMPEKIDFDILVTSHTDPGWTSLIALSKGLIIEHGGVLSHASIVARELNIPAVIGAKDAMLQLKDNQLVEIDGATGSITLLS